MGTSQYASHAEGSLSGHTALPLPLMLGAALKEEELPRARRPRRRDHKLPSATKPRPPTRTSPRRQPAKLERNEATSADQDIAAPAARQAQS